MVARLAMRDPPLRSLSNKSPLIYDSARQQVRLLEAADLDGLRQSIYRGAKRGENRYYLAGFSSMLSIYFTYFIHVLLLVI